MAVRDEVGVALEDFRNYKRRDNSAMAPSQTTATFEQFQTELASLVERFDRQFPEFTSPDYNEATLRADFLDPFFRALGWDVGNTKGLIHTEREVDIEVRTAVSGRQTRADYVFRAARVERFTCEAKKPAEVLSDRAYLSGQARCLRPRRARSRSSRTSRN